MASRLLYGLAYSPSRLNRSTRSNNPSGCGRHRHQRCLNWPAPLLYLGREPDPKVRLLILPSLSAFLTTLHK
jgi:hypothetical protein